MPRNVLTAVAWCANGPAISAMFPLGVPSDVFSRYMRCHSNVLWSAAPTSTARPSRPTPSSRARSPTATTGSSSRTCRGLGLTYDLFTRTTTRDHYAVTQEIFRTLHRNGYVVARTTLGAISPSTGRTLPDRYIEGTCPICGYNRGPRWPVDSCGNQLDPVDLGNPRSKINGEKPELVESEHFFLDLPAFAEALGGWLQDPQGLAARRPEVQPEPAQ